MRRLIPLAPEGAYVYQFHHDDPEGSDPTASERGN